ncbi:DUF2442 domain-containing protein [Pseudoflavitalea sp. X16]|uniref:DUF2442 domain-containing protein n=1 Tax=Paraflavitalea devenefica TaxID=2716334 RepID=UPI00141E8C3C|nr:DUF2442 domain-containing protein [Paraflavitalea devenefica]NII29897.1 DUF2442 domain-containing protein [Paraflavitalea devenefica]
MTNKIEKVWFDETRIFIELTDKTVIGAPVAWYPHLRKGTHEQLNQYEIWSEGTWLHWEELDEDLSLDGFLQLIYKKATA